MIYGMYLSATGVVANSYRQDVISNNLANAETVGFKRHLASFQERPVESAAEGRPDLSNSMLDKIGGGFLVSPTAIDTSQGDLESTGNNLDAAIYGKGYFAVDNNGKTELTRSGEFALDKEGNLVLSTAKGEHVLDSSGAPINIPGALAAKLEIAPDGRITDEHGKSVAKLGMFDVPDPSKLIKQGGNLMNYPDPIQSLKPSDSELRSGFVERANVDPTNELTQLMETQRQLEANANMIRYQDATLARAVNDLGKIG